MCFSKDTDAASFTQATLQKKTGILPETTVHTPRALSACELPLQREPASRGGRLTPPARCRFSGKVTHNRVS